MNDLKKHAEGLAQKGSWIRKGFRDFLDRWAEATAEDLRDEALTRTAFTHIEAGGNYTYYLRRNRNDLLAIHYDGFRFGAYSNSTEVSIDTIDMVDLKDIIAGLPSLLERYSESLKKRDREYQSVLAILNPMGCSEKKEQK